MRLDNKTEIGRATNRRVEAKITEILREGKDVAGNFKAEEELDNEDFDVLSALQRAARKGGVPKESYCSDDVILTTDIDPNDYIKNDNKGGGGRGGFNPGDFKLNLGDNFGRGDYIYGAFNMSAINFGFKNPNYEFTPNLSSRFDFKGIELTWVKENYKEARWRMYGLGSENTGLGFGHSELWTIRMHKLTSLNLNLQFGFDADVFGVISDNSNQMEAKGFLTIPVGIRYVHQLGALKIGPEIFYNHGIGSPENWPDATFLRIGSSVRWKIFQGGLFLNIGEEINYLGLRAGFAFFE